MTNPVFEWAKNHPGITAGTVGGIGVLVWLLSRSSGTASTSTSNASTIANSQLQQASLANQNAAVQAQAQVQEQTAAYAAQVQNNQNTAALAATVAQYNAQNNVAALAAGVQNNAAALAAGVQNNQITTTGGVQNTLINAELQAQQSQVAAETNLVNQNYTYKTAVATSVLPGAIKNLNNASNISANATNIIDTILGSPYAAGAASQSNVGYSQAQAAQTLGITNSVTGGVSSIFTSLFG